MNYEKFKLKDVLEFDRSIFESSYTYNDHIVPRVTQIISSCMHEDYIVQWANSLGFRHMSYKATLNTYAEYGTTVHEALEKYIKGEELPPNVPMNPINAFEKWWANISSNNEVKVLGQEFKLSCPYYGGTYDMLLSINDKPWLIDFKTSTHISFRYCLQLAAYREMLRYNNIADVSGVLVLRLFKDKPLYEEFVLDMNNEEHKIFLDNCSKLFHSMVYQYWWRNYLEKEYQRIYKLGRRNSVG